ncbi:MAG: sulfurtransferase-like selenium metabolism protein YedF [Negativicutes bacterium]|nr:sulfurtransferase-like selenium metabolism protein YedF [Negativicutes bacterium]
MSTEVDARGMDCPQPVIATKRALDSLTDGVMTTIVDNAVAKENVVKFAVANQCGVSVEEKNGHYYIRITKDASVVRPVDEPAPAAPGRVVYLITNNTLGHGSEELGAILIKAFFVSLLECQPLPRALLFLNAGVQLTTEGSPVLSHLKLLADQGVEILSCGTCLDYFSLKERLAIGGVTNMYNIVALMSKAGQAITL